MQEPIQNNSVVRQATLRDKSHIAALLYFESYVHRHLDWYQTLDWFDYQPFLVHSVMKKIRSILVCPPTIPENTWIRAFACRSNDRPIEEFKILWEHAKQVLWEEMHIPVVAAIPFYQWFKTCLIETNFEITNEIVMMQWTDIKIDTPRQKDIQIRVMTQEDLLAVSDLDKQAFEPLWQISPNSLSIAFGNAILPTVAIKDNRIVAYQITTHNGSAVHLARLATLPEYQGHGIGYAMMYDAIEMVRKNQCSAFTLNTQNVNQHSLSLYKRVGFSQTGESYPVMTYNLEN
jgi:ribosomal protein S18 acetylase RimI-like enzyme